MELTAIGLAFGAIICWSFNSFLIKKGLRYLSVSEFNSIRTSLACFLFIIFMLLSRKSIFSSAKLSIIASLTGVFALFVALNLFLKSLRKGSTYRLWPVGNTTPLWGTLSAIFVLGEKFDLFVLLSAVLVVAGILFLRKREGEGKGTKNVFLALLAAIIWGILIVPNKYCLNEGMSPFSFRTITVIAAAVTNNLYFLSKREFKGIIVGRKGISWALASGVVALSVGGISWQLALSIEKASKLAPFIGAEIPIVFLISVALLGEKPKKKPILGSILISLGILIVTTLS